MVSANEQTDELSRGIRQGGEDAMLDYLLRSIIARQIAAVDQMTQTQDAEELNRLFIRYECLKKAACHVKAAINYGQASVPPG